MASGKITIDLDFADDTKINSMRNDACQHWGYRVTIPDPANPTGPQIANPMSRNQFMEKQFVSYFKEAAKAQRADAAKATAIAAVIADVDATVIT